MLSVIIPALNEAKAIKDTILEIRRGLEKTKIEHEIIVVSDGSDDHTGKIVEESGAILIEHPCRGGYGRSIKSGILKAKYDVLAIVDADGTYPVEQFSEFYQLVAKEGFDMVVGARTGKFYQGPLLKNLARKFFLWLSEYATGEKIPDINSGMRVFRKEIPLKYWNTISNGFSFTTTLTLTAILNGYFIKYVFVEYHKRIGRSYVRYWRDTLRSLQIIVQSILYYNPLKIYLLVVNTLFVFFILSLGALLWLKVPQLTQFFSYFASFSLVGAFIVGAIGLAACRLDMLDPQKSKRHRLKN